MKILNMSSRKIEVDGKRNHGYFFGNKQNCDEWIRKLGLRGEGSRCWGRSFSNSEGNTQASLFEGLSGNSLTYTPDSTLSSIDKIQAVKNKLLGVFSRHFNGCGCFMINFDRIQRKILFH